MLPPFRRHGFIIWNTRGLLDLCSPDEGTESSNSYLKRLFDTIFRLQEVHGKDEFLQAIQVLVPKFRLSGTFLVDNENAGGTAICIHRHLLLEEALVAHLITCQGRHHLVNIQPERQNLVIVNVDFELALSLRQYVADCVLFTRIGLHTPVEWASVWVTSTSVIQKDVWSVEPDIHRCRPWKDCRVPFFHPSTNENAQSDYTRKHSSSFMTTTDSLLTHFVHLHN